MANWGEPMSDFTSVEQPITPEGSEGSLVIAVIAGAVAAAVGALAWAAITAATEYQIGFMAVGVGFLVGIAVRKFGRGQTTPFRLVAAVIAGLGCAVGNLFTAVYFFANEIEVPILRVVEMMDLELVSMLMGGAFSPIDLLFYGLAIFEAWKLAVESEEDSEEVLEV